MNNKINKLNILSSTMDDITEQYDIYKNDVIKIENENEKIRKKDILDILNNADNIIEEAEILKANRDRRKIEMIDIILKKTKKYGDFNTLSELTNDKLGEYIVQIKNKKSFIRKLFNI